MSSIRTYSELRAISDFKERFRYLALNGTVGDPTFGYDRWINQKFYASSEWRRMRRDVIVRDDGNEMGHPDFPIRGRMYVHHMNPMSPEDIIDNVEAIINPEFLITVSHDTHNAIHYGDERQLPRLFVERRPGDTKLW